MKLICDIILDDFEFDDDNREFAFALTQDEMDLIDAELEMLFPKGITAEELNEFFRFERDAIVSMLDYDSYEDFLEEREFE